MNGCRSPSRSRSNRSSPRKPRSSSAAPWPHWPPTRTWQQKNGRVFASWDLGEEYGIDDADGTRPHFLRWLQANQPDVAAAWKKLDDAFYAYWGSMPYEMPGG